MTAGRMLRVVTFVTAVVVLVGCHTPFYRYQNAECKQRGKTYAERAEHLKHEAGEVLKVGAKRQVVMSFFEQQGLPATFTGNEITGTIRLKGCAPAGCGTDDAILGLRVEVDKEGTVVSKPIVGAIYTNCM